MDSQVPIGKQNSEQKPKNAQGNPKKPKDNKRWYQKLREKWGNMTPANRFLVVFTGIIAATTVAYAVVAYCQWTAMRDSNRINRQSLESVQRAFIYFTHFEAARLVNPPNSGPLHWWSFSPFIENSGTTPAIQAINHTFVQELSGEPDDATFRGDKVNFPVASLPPKSPQGLQSLKQPEEYIFGKDLGDLGKIKAAIKPKQIFLWGWVGYRDVFPKTGPHLTEFCFKLIGFGVNAKNEPHWEWASCQEHNCTDQYCKDYANIAAWVPEEKTAN